ncbi:hypothetical protein LCGC14_2927380, partial [marine sediment metagenome]
IDAIGHTDSQIHIIEITRVAGLKAVGQLLSYPLLYCLTFKPLRPVRSVLVCHTLETDIEPMILANHIICYYCGPAPPQDASNQASQPTTPPKQSP